MSLEKLIALQDRLPQKYKERLAQELEVIIENKTANFLPYFVTLADIVKKAHELGIEVGPGRGSAGGSLVAFIFGIVKIDPIKENLPFSRFLSHARLKKSIPDIDLDFMVDEKNGLHRDVLNDYIFQKYGDRAAQVATFGLLKCKNALLDSWRINVIQPTEFKIKKLIEDGKRSEAAAHKEMLEKKTNEFNQIRKSLGNCPVGIDDKEWLDGYIRDEIYHPGLLETAPEFKAWTDLYPEVLSTARSLLGIPRSIGKHAAGIVIADRPLHEICPVMKVDGISVIAYDKKTIQKIGLIKNDLLGLTCLNFVSQTKRTLANRGIIIDPWDLPDKPEVYKEFKDGKCLSIFQHETIGGANFVKRLNPSKKSDISVSIALNRPGAIDAMVKMEDGSEISAADLYIERANGREPVKYLHPDLEPILKDTLALYVFQESVMKTCQDLLGFTEEESDTIRAGISDKDPKAFDELKSRLPLLEKRGWKKEQIDELFNNIIAFSRYSFNNAHSAAYREIAYTTAYLKHFYPEEWWAAVLTHSKPDEAIEKYWPEIGHKIIMPNVNHSTDQYVPKGDKLIAPLSLIDGVGDKVIPEIMAHSPYQSLDDFMAKVSARIVNKKVVINLIKTHAMDELFDPSATLQQKITQYLIAKAFRENRKKLEDLPEGVADCTPYQEFLFCKRLLPVSSLDLLTAIKQTNNVSKPIIHTEGKDTIRGAYTLVPGSELYKKYQSREKLDSDVILCSYGYVIATRVFTYYSKKYESNKTAMEIILDFDGNQIKTVSWPRKDHHKSQLIDVIKEKTAYLFKLKLSPDKDWNFSIMGVEEILEKKDAN